MALVTWETLQYDREKILIHVTGGELIVGGVV